MSDEVLQRRLTDLTNHIAHLKDRVPTRLEEYLAHIDTRLICERLIELIVEAATDVNSALMMREGREPPQGQCSGITPAALACCPAWEPTD